MLPLVFALCAVAALRAQAPAPGNDARADLRGDVAHLAALGEAQLRAEDPVAAQSTFRAILGVEPDDVAALVGLGRSELLLGRAARALDLAIAAIEAAPHDDEALALRVRALLRARRFAEAVAASTAAIAAGDDGIAVLAAHASALFRTQRNDEAAEFYRRVLAIDPLHAEAHLRLGSGLTAACAVRFGPDFDAGVAALRRGQLEVGIGHLRNALGIDPGNPVVHRLIGEALFQKSALASMACTSPEFARVAALVPRGDVDLRVATEFMPDLPTLVGARRDVALNSLASFGSRLPELVRRGGAHDLLAEDERTTDAPSRSSLRGKKTFDGRIWDDVRGIGGLRAATGIEALDEAAVFGFDTLAHEIAHQVHLHALGKRSLQIRIRELYDAAIENNRCLDYYAASNHAEYFGQGVEAFVSLVKRPTVEATHGHTRFELMRVDPALHALIAELVDVDPLASSRDPEERSELLTACVDAAIRAGRTDDARTAAAMIPDPARRGAAIRRAEAAAARIDAW